MVVFQLCSKLVAARRRRAQALTSDCKDSPPAATLISLPLPLLHEILIAAAPTSAGAVRSCRSLRDAWRSALTDPVLAARFLINRYGLAAAALHVYDQYGNAAGIVGADPGFPPDSPRCGASAPPLLCALLRGLPPARRGDAALALIRALAAEGAVPLGVRRQDEHDVIGATLDDDMRVLGVQVVPNGVGEGLFDNEFIMAGNVILALMRGAARFNHRPVVKELVAAGAPAPVVAAGLAAAAAWGHLDLVRELMGALGVPVRREPGANGPAAAATAAAAAAARGREDGGMDREVPQPAEAAVQLEGQEAPPPPESDNANAAPTAAGNVILPAAAAAVPIWVPNGAPPPAAATLPVIMPNAVPLLGPALVAAAGRRTPRHYELVALLLAAGADPRVGNSEPLVRAAAAGSTITVRLLLAAGADPRAGRCRPLVVSAEVLRARVVCQLLATRSYSYGDISAVARELLVPPLVSSIASLAVLLLPWLTLAALLMTASAPLVFGCVLLCLWNGLWVVSALSVLGYGLGLALAAAAVGLAAGMTVAAWATSVGLLLQFLLRAVLRRTAMDGAAAVAAAGGEEEERGPV